MASKILTKFKDFKELYFLPVLIIVPIKAVTDAYQEYTLTKNNTLAYNTFGCLMGGLSGIYSGIFLGVLWPISFPIWVARLMDKDKDKDKDKK